MLRRKIDQPAQRFWGLTAWFTGALALMGFVWSGTAHAEAVECFVYDDGYTNMAGPSDAILFRGPERDIWGQGKACIPDGTGTGTCRKWFGRCRTTVTHQPVSLWVVDDFHQNSAGPADSVYVNGGRACIPDNTGTGTCRQWFLLGYSVWCRLFEDGYTAQTELYDQFRFKPHNEVCSDYEAPCRKWIGRCTTEAPAQRPIQQQPNQPTRPPDRPAPPRNPTPPSAPAASWYKVGCACSFGVSGEKSLCLLRSSSAEAQAFAICNTACRIAFEQAGLSGSASSSLTKFEETSGSCAQNFANTNF